MEDHPEEDRLMEDHPDAGHTNVHHITIVEAIQMGHQVEDIQPQVVTVEETDHPAVAVTIITARHIEGER